MTWWEILIIVLLAASAVTAGLFLGRFLSRKWPFPFAKKRVTSGSYLPNGSVDPLKVMVEKNKERWESARMAREKGQQAPLKLGIVVTGDKVPRAIGTSAKEQAERLEQEKAEQEAQERKMRDEREKMRLEAESLAKKESEQLAVKQAGGKASDKVLGAGSKAISEQTGKVLGDDVLSEVSANLKIAKQSRIGQPEPFNTEVWDSKNSEISYLPVELRYELGEAYTDIRLANNIVWLVTEVGGASTDFKRSYEILCGKIAERLSGILGKM